METKTEQVRSQVFRAILQGHYTPGSKIPPEREMAQLTGTSRITVRRAYAELEQSGILERHPGRGTHIATAVRGYASVAREIALLASVRDPFALDFIEAMESAIVEHDALLILRVTEEDPAKEEAAAIDLVGKGVHDLVVWPSGGRFAAETFRRLRILGTNMVFFDRMLPGPYADFVGLDNAHAVTTLLEAAVMAGWKQFVFVSHDGLDADSDRQREDAFKRWCLRKSVPHRLVRVPWRGDVPAALRASRKAWFGAGDSAGAAAQPAIICVNDDIALQVKTVCGADADVYGIDGLPEAVAAGIPTYAQPMKEMARKAIELLADQQEQHVNWMARQVYCRGELVRPGASS